MVRRLKALKYVILMVSKMGSLVATLGEIYWKDDLMQIMGCEYGRDRF